MKIPFYKILRAARFMAVLLTICALIACGATAAERQASMLAAKQEAQQAKIDAADLLEPGADEAGRGEMEPGETPNIEPSAWLISAVITKTGNDEQRPRRDLAAERTTAYSESSTTHIRTATPSPTRVSTDLGRQFTLVGAKPSGTS
ncbi:hypothetical protein KQH82_10120 [bacterium]|nr:hypothetical protein [bacterium]